MKEIVCCDWLPEQARWSDLARSGLPAVSRKQNFPKSHIINPLLTKFVRSRWLDIGLVLFYLDFVSVHKHAKKELGQYQAILTSHLVNNPCICSIREHGYTHLCSRFQARHTTLAKETRIFLQNFKVFL